MGEQHVGFSGGESYDATPRWSLRYLFHSNKVTRPNVKKTQILFMYTVVRGATVSGRAFRNWRRHQIIKNRRLCAQLGANEQKWRNIIWHTTKRAPRTAAITADSCSIWSINGLSRRIGWQKWQRFAWLPPLEKGSRREWRDKDEGWK